jgi:hypothetical protein
MALWGNTDAISVKSGGTISINYATLAVTGAGTSFGVTGFAGVGDVLRVGTRVGTGTYFGDAVIVAVASTISCTIGSTIGLLHSGPNAHTATGSTTFQVSRLPKYTTTNPAFSEDPDFNREPPSNKVIYTGVALTASGIGASVLSFDTTLTSGNGLFGAHGIKAGDFVSVGGADIEISSVSTASVSAAATCGVGTNIISIAGPVPGITRGDFIDVAVAPGEAPTVDVITATSVTIGSTISSAIPKGAAVSVIFAIDSKFDDGRPTGGIGLASTISSAVTAGAQIQFKRESGGYHKNVYAVAQGGKESAAGGQYQVDHAGWVGVTTYIDNHGNLRVKKETLVAMSGITTGNVPLYDSNPLA